MKIDGLSLGCWYEACNYYRLKPHPKTERKCEWGNPACLRGKIDLCISLSLFATSKFLSKWRRLAEAVTRNRRLHKGFLVVIEFPLACFTLTWIGLWWFMTLLAGGDPE